MSLQEDGGYRVEQCRAFIDRLMFPIISPVSSSSEIATSTSTSVGIDRDFVSDHRALNAAKKQVVNHSDASEIVPVVN